MSIYLASRLPDSISSTNPNIPSISAISWCLPLPWTFFPVELLPKAQQEKLRNMESRLRWLREARGRKAKATPTASPTWGKLGKSMDSKVPLWKVRGIWKLPEPKLNPTKTSSLKIMDFDGQLDEFVSFWGLFLGPILLLKSELPAVCFSGTGLARGQTGQNQARKPQ